MLEPTKKPRTDDVVEMCFKIRKDMLHKAEQAVKPYLAEEDDENEMIPWREAFPDFGPHVALRGARAKEGVTQKQLAEKVGIRPEHISAMENNRRPIGKNMAKRFAEVLKVDYRVFL